MRHHVYALKQPKNPHRPYVLDLQNDLLADFKSRLVAPLQRLSTVNSKEIMTALMPVLNIGGEDYVLFVQEAAAYPSKGLGKQVADLRQESSVVLNALDRLLG